jgi:hypothetical protein
MVLMRMLDMHVDPHLSGIRIYISTSEAEIGKAQL